MIRRCFGQMTATSVIALLLLGQCGWTQPQVSADTTHEHLNVEVEETKHLKETEEEVELPESVEVRIEEDPYYSHVLQAYEKARDLPITEYEPVEIIELDSSLYESKYYLDPYQLGCLYPLFPRISYTAGPGRGYQRGYETIEAMWGVYDFQKGSYPYLDVRLHHVQSDEFAGNVGAGWRKFSLDYEQMVGFNAYYDFRKFTDGTLHQLGLGLELLSKCWDIRVNGYIPLFNDRILRETTIFNFSGDRFVRLREFLGEMWGVDAEIGGYLCCSPKLSIYTGIGPYFYGSGCCNNLVGGLGRIHIEYCKYFDFQFFITQDKLYNTKAQGQIGITIPTSRLTNCFRCLFPHIYRNPIIVTETLCCFDSNYSSVFR